MSQHSPNYNLSIGVVAREVGATPNAIRNWENRYGLNPSTRSHGGHRRYCRADTALYQEFAQLLTMGLKGAVAVRLLLSPPPQVSADWIVAVAGLERSGEHLLVRAHLRLIIAQHVSSGSWRMYIRPLLDSPGLKTERLESDVRRELRRTALQGPRGGVGTILLCTTGKAMPLEMLVLHAGLTGLGVPARSFDHIATGRRLHSIVVRMVPAAVVIFSPSGTPANQDLRQTASDLTHRAEIVASGAGWQSQAPPRVLYSRDPQSCSTLLQKSSRRAIRRDRRN